MKKEQIDINLKERDDWIDNIKGVLICLVIMGHFALLLVGHSREMVWFRQFISVFHMPAFMILTGMLAQNNIRNKSYNKMINRLFIPYLICNFIMFLIFKILGVTTVSGIEETWFFIPLRPYYFLWFLLAAFLFAVITPKFSQNKRQLLIAFIIAILIGFIPKIDYMVLTKIIPFYLYYLVGYYTESEKLKIKLKKKHILISSITIIALVIIFTQLYTEYIDISFLSMEKQYRDYTNISQYKSAFFRGITMIVSIIVSFSVFSCIPEKKCFITTIGKYSIYPYCLHTFMMPFAFYCIKRSRFGVIDNWIEYILAFGLCILGARILTSRFVRKYTKVIIEPTIEIEFLHKQKI